MDQPLANIEPFLKDIKALSRRYGVEKLYLFGSVVTDRFDRDNRSDVDVLIQMPETMPPLDRGENILGLWSDLENLLDRTVDLLTTTQLKNPYLIADINEGKVLVYDHEDEKIFV